MGSEDTLVLPENYLDKSGGGKSAPAPAPVDPKATWSHIVNRELLVDGVTFEWWAVGEHPSLVTVQAASFGRRARFTRGDQRAFARELAKSLLAQHCERAALLREASQKQPAQASVEDPLQ
jgi:hypothetical protein